MKKTTIQTLHPEKGKKNQRIPTEKYETIKAGILAILAYSAPTHTQLIVELSVNLRDSFKDNIDWYGMVVKLDLEARKIIVRSSSKLKRYSLQAPFKKSFV